jgi:predicted nucleic acid-binding protein
LSLYLDACVVVSLFIADDHTPRVRTWMTRRQSPLILSEWAITEFSSALALRRRMKRLDPSDRLEAESNFDAWLSSKEIVRVDVDARDFYSARHLMRFDSVELRAADALHLAIAMRLGVAIATLDDELAAAAAAVGMRLEPV